ncbi:hypothetical protein MLD38_011223 [Melastoma candidum]|uniref:Uncharacterized protein n=1 Tax=Melastoma candidum TaxID=119954 RepID=A0ACB9RAP4_9MYRT|nr:hypothetical protein MLD38_011223 [Melastoma candidum]
MHEYRLTDEELEKAGVPQDAFVLCRIFQKSGPGPKNGEQYGAPFVEEEWEDDDEAVFPDQEPMVVTDDAYFETADLDQCFDNGITSGNTSLLVNPLHEGASSGAEFYEDVHGDDEQKPQATVTEVPNNLEQEDDNKYFVLLEQYPAAVRSFKKEFVGEVSSNVDIPHIEDTVDGGFVFDGPYLDAADHPFFGDGTYLENELSSLIDSDPTDFNVGDFLTFDVDGENLPPFESTEQKLPENVISDQTPTEENAVEGDKIQAVESQLLAEFYESDFASSSNQHWETKDESNIKYPFMKTASHMLGSFPAPPAFAAEFPSKDVTLRLNAIAQPSSSVHVTAGIVRIRNLSLSNAGMNLFVGKNGELNIILSFGISNAQDAAADRVFSSGMPRGKSNSAVSWSWLLCLFFWVLLLSVTVKVGSSIHTRNSSS